MSQLCFLLAAVVATMALHLASAAIEEEDESIEVVTYGSTIKLEHVPSAHRLHSHDVSYGSGSRQQSVTGVSQTGDSNSFWIVKGAHDAPQKLSGTPVRCGHAIRLQHLNTGKNLHSHDHRAPMNSDNEVSAYAIHHEGKWAYGDVADNWVLECVESSGDWKRFEKVRLKHEERGTFLSANANLKFGQPIPGQLQISSARRKNANTVWKTNEGFYIGPVKS